MILLPVTLNDNAVVVMIEDQVCFVFEDILRRFFANTKLVESAGEDAS